MSDVIKQTGMTTEQTETKQTAIAMLHSLDMDGRHNTPLQEVEILRQVADNDYIVRTPAGITCHGATSVLLRSSAISYAAR